MRFKITFTLEGREAIALFENHELIEMLEKYLSYFSGQFGNGVIFDHIKNKDIIKEGAFIIQVNDGMGITKDDVFFNELSKCIRSLLLERYKGVLTKIFITELLE